MNYPKKHNLDGFYNRVQRDGRYENVCFTDLTHDEQEAVLANYDTNALKRTCFMLADILRTYGESYNIINTEGDMS